MIDSVAIVSGGMDSVTLLHALVKQEHRTPAVLTFAYGQKHSQEIACARYQAALLGCTDHEVMDLSTVTPAFAASALVSSDVAIPAIEAVRGDPQPATYVPNRNLVFLSIAVAYAESRQASAVYYGAQRHDLYGYWDTTPQFVDRLNAVLGLNRRSAVRVKTPLVDLSKADVLRLGLALGVDYARTWSCYAGGDRACGTCPTCAERLQAFAEAGQSDPLSYYSRTG
jgi:7-cyano-7-deazaguanine synthase